MSKVEGNDITIAACGIMVAEALVAVENLAKQGVKARLINVHSLRPLDTQLILKAAKETRGIIVCEEHNIIGGLASSIDEIVAENNPTRIMRIGVRNRFGQSGEPAQLLKEYNLTSADIEKAALTCFAKCK